MKRLYIISFALSLYFLVATQLVLANSISVVGKAVVENSGNSYLDFTGYNSNVAIDNTNGTFSGHAWLEDVGWVAFGTADNPSGPVSVNLTTGAVSGKAYVLNTGAYLDFTGYNSNVSINIDTKNFSGFAWSEDVGWLNFGDTGVSTLTNLDTTAPTPAIITSIGYISNVLDRTFLAYYFTSQTPLIRGTTEASAAVHFKNGSQDYTTTAGSDGKFTITLQSPDLPRQKVTLTYYSEDAAGNVSSTRTLVLIIGIENFPTGSDEPTPTADVTSDVTGTPSVTTTVAITDDPIMPTILTLKVQDETGKALIGAIVTIDGQRYTSDSKGNIYLEGTPTKDAKVTIDYKGAILAGYVLSDKVISGTAPTVTTAQNNINIWIYIFVALVLLITGYLFWRWKRK